MADAFLPPEVQNDPEIRRILAQYAGQQRTQGALRIFGGGWPPEASRAIEARLRQLGIRTPSGTSVQISRDGRIGYNDDTTLADAMKQFAPMAAAVVGGGAALGAFGGGVAGAGAGGAGSASSSAIPPLTSTVPTTVGSVPSSLLGGGATGAVTAGTTAATTAGTTASGTSGLMSFLKQSLIPDLVTGLGRAVIGGITANKAANAQQEAADKAIALQRDIYNQQRTDLAPYRQVGGQAVNTLGGLMGFPTNAMGRAPEKEQMPGGIQPGETRTSTFSNLVRPQPAPIQAPAGQQTLATLAQGVPAAQAQAQTQSSFRRMRAPDGRVFNVPEPFVEQALANGGVPV